MKYILIATIFSMMVACSSTGNYSDYSIIAGMVAFKATTEIIDEADNKEARARRILLYTDTAFELVDSETPVTLDGLYEEITGLIEWDKIPPQDQPLVEDLLQLVRQRLALEANEEIGLLEPDVEVALLHIISRIRSAAEWYLAKSDE